MKKVVQPVALRQVAIRTPHPFEACFHDLGSYSAIEALDALAKAVEADRSMNAYDWVESTLPGAALKPAYAFGTVGELSNGYSRGQEFKRFITTVRAHEDAVRDTNPGKSRTSSTRRYARG
ncbi:hypothetical protein [Burkholderia cenocepacia]|uniref:hypothetical protein n=1 Tax=Burkholderia cenocepacia TaxID=95486 RepID=UPI000A9790A2|nr:hypothetical protein [Burkholderia cenocepacia]